MDWSFITRYSPLYVKAAVLTLTIGAVGIVLAALVGLLCAFAKYYRVPVFRQIAAAYTELSRNTPLIVQLFFLYFGLPKAGIVLSSEACGIIGLAFLGGSYMSESFLSGLESVKKGQIESAESLGLNGRQVMRYVVFPQAAAVSLPAVGANAGRRLAATPLHDGRRGAGMVGTAVGGVPPCKRMFIRFLSVCNICLRNML